MSSSDFPKRSYAHRPRKVPGAQPRVQKSQHEPRHEKSPVRPPRPAHQQRPLPSEQSAEPASPESPTDKLQPRPALPTLGGAGTPGTPAADTAWEAQAGWYDKLQGDRGDGFYSTLILPAVMRQLEAYPQTTVLDVCCGQGVLGRELAVGGVSCVGVDASPALIAAASARAGDTERYVVGDARNLQAVLGDERFDGAALVMALQDLDPIAPVLAGVAALVKPGGRVVIVMTHPVLRIPRRTTWGFDDEIGVQYRRLDGYLSPMRLPIRTHPGQPADTSATSTFHRPLHVYLNACGDAGLGIIGCEELCSERRGTRGPRFGAEDRAAKEFPVFLVLTAIRLA